MRRILSLLLLVLFAAPALARPVEREGLPGLQAEPTAVPLVPQSGPGIETYYFGGTVWAPDSMRWEAVPDSIWTFETGVGSHFQHTDPNKNPAFHASMEGWTGVDLTVGPPSQRFRRLSANDFTPDPSCVGSPAGLGGNCSFWAGLLEGEADSLCWAAGQGYGNHWNICIHKDYAYDGGCLRLSYNFRNETEAGYDYTYVLVDTSGGSVAGGDVVAAYYTGVVDGSAIGAQLDLTPGVTLPGQAGPIRISFCLVSDGGYSDEDGDNPTACGAFAVDDIVVSNAACGGSFLDESTFETGADGWEVEADGYPRVIGGDWSRLAAVADLPPLPDSLGCDFGDSVLVLFDPDGPFHPYYQDNLAVSPWIDLRRAGKVGYPGKFIEMGGYRDLPLENYIFAVPAVQWYPDTCDVTGKIRMSDMKAYVYHTPNGPSCGSPVFHLSLDNVVSVGAEQIRIGVGVVNWCRFFGGACGGMSNTSPWFDNIRFGVTSFGGIQYALDHAAEGDTVWVPPDTYAADSFDFKGKNVVLKSTAGPEETIITGGGRGEEYRAFVFQSGEDSTAVVEGFTIQNCDAPQQPYPEHYGSAVVIKSGSSPTFRDCTFFHNHGFRGGAVYITGSGSPAFRDCRFLENTARDRGGAVAAEEGATVRILGSTLNRNSGDQGTQNLFGGAVYTGTGSPDSSLIQECTFEENLANSGSAVWGRNVVLKGSTFLNNTAQGSGGGAYLMYGVVEDCGFAFNVSGYDGGGLYANRCDITQSAFFANQASGDGGGVYAPGCRLFDCRIENNSASSGGGIFLSLASAGQFSYVRGEMHDCILRSNRAGQQGGGAYLSYFGVVDGGKIVGNSGNQGGGAFARVLSVYWPDSLVVTGVQITGNLAHEGGGIDATVCEQKMTLESSTVSGNRAAVGGGIHSAACAPGYFEVNSTILFGNCADSSGNSVSFANSSAGLTLTCCNVDTFGISGPGTIVYDGPQVYQNPEFCSPTPSYLAPTIAGIYSLAESSPNLPTHNACGVLIGALGEGCSIVAAPREEEPPVLAPAMTVSANPFRGSLTIHYEAPEGTEPVLRVYDVRGALVQDLPLIGSLGTITWEGRSRSGASAPSGVYFLQLVAGNDRRSLRVVRMR